MFFIKIIRETGASPVIVVSDYETTLEKISDLFVKPDIPYLSDQTNYKILLQYMSRRIFISILFVK